MAGQLRIDKRGHVGVLIFDHEARRNAITAQMWRDIPGAVQELSDDKEIRVVVMRGAGEVAFVAGADISEFEQVRAGPEAQAYDASNAKAFAALSALPKPLIAMVHGFCIGGGTAIALCADMRMAAEDAMFGIPAARLGLGYSMSGLETLIRTVGLANAKEIFFTAQRFNAQEAMRLGLLQGVYRKSELEGAVFETAWRIARNAPLTIRAAKVAMQELAQMEAKRDVDRVERAIAECYASADYKEGVAAFLEKRLAEFKGQ